jgi:putative flippase GtrA
VRLVRELYTRFRQLIHEVAKFGVVGLVGVAISFGGAAVLRFDFGFGKYTSVTVATTVATVVAFIGNRYWTFRHRERTGTARETVLFFALNGVGLLIQYACIGITQDVLGLSGKLWYNIANLVGIGLGTLFRFWTYRKWVWALPPAEPGVVQPAMSPRKYGGRHRATSGSRSFF